MKSLAVVFIFIICFVSVGIILFLESFIDNFFIIPILESVVIFFSVWFIYKFSEESLLAICFIFAFFFLLLENGVYALAIALDMVDLSYKTVLSWRFLYNSIFIFIYIPLLCNGLKYKDKALWVLYFIIGMVLHLIFNLVMGVVS